jgi:hypothetical protein
MKKKRTKPSLLNKIAGIAIFAAVVGLAMGGFKMRRGSWGDLPGFSWPNRSAANFAVLGHRFYPRQRVTEDSGLPLRFDALPRWKPDASLEEIRNSWRRAGYLAIEKIEKELADASMPEINRVLSTLTKSTLLNAEAETRASYQLLKELRTTVEANERLATTTLSSVMFLQGVTALRQGENDNCIMCRGESSCILPIAPSAVHANPAGSRLAVQHFTEYLDEFSRDLAGRWLLNLAHMTLGEYPDKVDPRFRLDLSQFFHSEFDIGKFRDVGHLVGVNRYNQAGGAIMEDFDNDGLLDIAVTSFDAATPMSLYRNSGAGTFEDRSREAGVTPQLGGLVCYQTDYNNDGFMDIFIARGAWCPQPMRPTLLCNNGKGGFIDVTQKAGLLDPVNSNAAAWADYDNDGWLDLFVGCENQTNRLFHNKGDGTFEELAAKAGVQGDPARYCKGCVWFDHDNDGYPDLFVNNMFETGHLYHNNRDGTFEDATTSLGIDGPKVGFSCWAWDYDNDGWLDLFATSYDRTLGDVVKGMLGQRHDRFSNRLYRNNLGQSFADLTQEAGLDMVFATMGSNYGDFDSDGWLDMYLATGEPTLGFLIPNRMLKNVGGKRFADITGSSRTGLLQKGHGVACGDWDRDGDVDLFAQTGGAFPGDKYHNVMFQNPGQGNHSLTVKLIGKKTNRAAIGARIKVVTAGENPLTIHTHISSGSSFGANALQQTMGLAASKRVATLEIYWPTSKSTQVFHDVLADQAIEVTEFAASYRPLDWKPLPSVD